MPGSIVLLQIIMCLDACHGSKFSAVAAEKSFLCAVYLVIGSINNQSKLSAVPTKLPGISNFIASSHLHHIV